VEDAREDGELMMDTQLEIALSAVIAKAEAQHRLELLKGEREVGVASAATIALMVEGFQNAFIDYLARLCAAWMEKEIKQLMAESLNEPRMRQ